jgi:hypothetical protein
LRESLNNHQDLAVRLVQPLEEFCLVHTCLAS